MSKAVQELFESIAPTYDFLNHCLSFSIDKRWRDKAVEGLEGLRPNRILDLCAGTLDLTQKLLQKFPKQQVHAVDFSLAMLEAGSSKVEKSKNSFRICADGHRLPFSDRSFEAVLCAFGIRNLEDRDKACGEIRRVLKPGGRLVVLEFFRPESFFPQLFHQTYGKYVLPRIGGAISKNRAAYEYLQNSIAEFLSVEEYCNLLKGHGFKNTQSLALSGGIAHRVVAEG